MDNFESRALQLAFDLTIHNAYDGKVGQGYNEARAEDVRRIFNILSGRAAEDNGSKAAKPAAAPRKRKLEPSE